MSGTLKKIYFHNSLRVKKFWFLSEVALERPDLLCFVKHFQNSFKAIG